MNIEKIIFRYLPNLLYNKEVNYVKQQWVCYKWVVKHLDWSKADVLYDSVHNHSVLYDKTIFMYWKQGWDNAPKLVKKCLKSVKENCGEHPLLLLDETNIHDFIRLPEYIEEYHNKGLIKEALYSDMLRICLLEEYGGYWMDATCYLSAQIPKEVECSEFFMFSSPLLPEWSSPLKGSNWFLHSIRGNYILHCIKNFLFNYWKNKHYLINYYIFHITLAAIINNDKDALYMWNHMPYICNMNPHVFQFNFKKSYDKDSYDFLLTQCFVHKLTYKYDNKLVDSKKENNLKHFLNS